MKTIPPIPLPVYQTWESLESIVLAAQQELPDMTANQLATWFGVYHNTLINLLKAQASSDKTDQ